MNSAHKTYQLAEQEIVRLNSRVPMFKCRRSASLKHPILAVQLDGMKRMLRKSRRV